jgi:hypothetical protein
MWKPGAQEGARPRVRGAKGLRPRAQVDMRPRARRALGPAVNRAKEEKIYSSYLPVVFLCSTVVNDSSSLESSIHDHRFASPALYLLVYPTNKPLPSRNYLDRNT